MTSRHIQTRREDGVEYLVLNRPEVRNALNEEVIAQITDWARAIATDPDVRAVVISGAGPSFCAGADIAWMTKMAGYSRDENIRDARAAAAMFAGARHAARPADCEGAWRGRRRRRRSRRGGRRGRGGQAAMFGVLRGEARADSRRHRTVRAGEDRHLAARELFVTGRRFDAEHARRIGLVHALWRPIGSMPPSSST